MRRLLLLLLLVLTASHASEQFVTRVVVDDTIVVQGVGPVRLIGVDTPETVDPRKPVQFFGKATSEFHAADVSLRITPGIASVFAILLDLFRIRLSEV